VIVVPDVAVIPDMKTSMELLTVGVIVVDVAVTDAAVRAGVACALIGVTVSTPL
jgi:hypothetical protein